MSSKMFDITYAPDFQVRSRKHPVFEILWNGSSAITTGDMREVVSISRENLYMDIDRARGKVRAIKTIWGSDKRPSNFIQIVVATNLLKESEGVISHVLFEMMIEFIPDMHMSSVHLQITHVGRKNANMVSVIDVIRKIFAARMIGMTPANVATPEYMAKLYKKMFDKVPNAHVHVLRHRELMKQHFGLLLGVGNSGKVKPTFVYVERKGSSPNSPCIALVGKGVTFDSGGLAVKPLMSMIDMKYDKLGATYAAAILLHLMEDSRLNHVTFIGAFPFAENAISENALRPGDVIKSYSGKTVEVLNPDAEGRLILADAFSFVCKKYKPDLLIDLATLTGHAGMINCWHNAYFYCSSSKMRKQVENIGEQYGERMLAMPTWPEYADVLKSNVADLVNSPLTCGDAFVAALFLKEFVPTGVTWLHLDLAHEVNLGMIPTGYSIRTVIGVVENYLGYKK